MNVSQSEARGAYEPPFPDPESWPLDEAVSPDEEENLIRAKDYRKQQQLEAELARSALAGELIDGSAAIGLFEGVQVTEGTDGDSFVVPPRILETPQRGVWQLDVAGRVHWFKQISDFGDLRFTPKGEAGWIPHVYPFEELDGRHLPVIKDRERAEVSIHLTQLIAAAIYEYPEELRLETPFGIFKGSQSIETWYSWGGREGCIEFDEFVVEGKELHAEQVIFDDKATGLDYELGRPNEWQGEHFGSIWVPMDLLRAGINPLVSFPAFVKSDEKTAR